MNLRTLLAAAAPALAALWAGSALAQTPITIGAIEILSGPASAYGIAIRNGFDLALGEVNKAGGINGTPLAIDYEDSAGKPDQAMNAARQLIGSKKVPLILGPTLSNEMFPVGPIANERKVPIVGTSTTANGITAIGPYVFRTSLPEADVVPVTLRTAKDKLGIKKVAVLYGNDDAFTKSAYDVMKGAIEKLGLETLTTETFGAKDSDFSAQMTKKWMIRISPSSHHCGQRRPAERFVVGLRRRFRALRGAQLGGAGTRINSQLIVPRRDGTLGENLETRLNLRDIRQMPRAAGALAAGGQEILDDTILERVERHHHQPSAGPEQCGDDPRPPEYIGKPVDRAPGNEDHIEALAAKLFDRVVY